MSRWIVSVIPVVVEAVVTAPTAIVAAVVAVTAPEFAAVSGRTADSHRTGGRVLDELYRR
jgi:hypothetical protein